MEHKISEPNARVDVADVLRGLAVMGIIIYTVSNISTSIPFRTLFPANG